MIDTIFVFDEYPDEPTNIVKLSDIVVGERFKFGNKVFTKTSNLGWSIGYCNVVDVNNKAGYIHPSKIVEKI